MKGQKAMRRAEDPADPEDMVGAVILEVLMLGQRRGDQHGKDAHSGKYEVCEIFS